MRICIIGNSHAGMLIAALRDSGASAETVFFGKPNLEPRDFSQNGRMITAKSEGLRERLAQIGTPETLDMDDFDIVVIVAMAPSVFSTARLSQNHCITGWPSGQLAMEQTLSGRADKSRNRPFLSRAALREALIVLTQTCGAYQLAHELRADSTVPIAVVPQPFPSADLLAQAGKYPILRRISQSGDACALASDLDTTKRAVFETIDRLDYLAQPDATVTRGCFSAPEFMRGAVRLSQSAKQPAHDVLHGNARLGAVFLNQIQPKTPTKS